jgi:hypothetical protein
VFTLVHPHWSTWVPATPVDCGCRYELSPKLSPCLAPTARGHTRNAGHRLTNPQTRKPARMTLLSWANDLRVWPAANPQQTRTQTRKPAAGPCAANRRPHYPRRLPRCQARRRTGGRYGFAGFKPAAAAKPAPNPHPHKRRSDTLSVIVCGFAGLFSTPREFRHQSRTVPLPPGG